MLKSKLSKTDDIIFDLLQIVNSFNPIQTGGGSKVPTAPKMPSKLRKSKKIQKNNYKFREVSMPRSCISENRDFRDFGL